MDVKKLRVHQIENLASRCEGTSWLDASRLYSRCVRFCLRYARWNEEHCNGVPNHMRVMHEHEGGLLAALEERLNHELEPYGLKFEHNGIYPGLVDESNNNPVELLWC